MPVIYPSLYSGQRTDQRTGQRLGRQCLDQTPAASAHTVSQSSVCWTPGLHRQSSQVPMWRISHAFFAQSNVLLSSSLLQCCRCHDLDCLLHLSNVEGHCLDSGTLHLAFCKLFEHAAVNSRREVVDFPCLPSSYTLLIQFRTDAHS